MATGTSPQANFVEKPQYVSASASAREPGVVKFLWTLALFLVIVALLPGRSGLAVGTLVALGAVLFAPKLPEFLQTVVRGGA